MGAPAASNSAANQGNASPAAARERLSALPTERRQRTAGPDGELRATAGADGQPAGIDGYAAVFNSPSEPLSDGWGFSWIETIRPRAFAKTLQEADVRALMNHNPDYVLGRNAAGTLTLEEDSRGLHFAVEPPDTQWARDLVVSMDRGDVNQCSFAFQCVRDRWTEDHESGALYRELLEVKLYDVSVVTYPAYPSTSASVVRALLGEAGIDLDRVASAVVRSRAGLPLGCDDLACVRSAIESLQQQVSAVSSTALDGSRPPALAPNLGLGRRDGEVALPLGLLRRQLELASLV